MTDDVIRRLFPDDWAFLRAIRLEALRLHPEAYLSTLALEEPFTEADWRGRLTGSAIFATGQDGIAALLPDGCVVMVYVRASARGTGRGAALMKALRAEARARNLSRIWLHVAKNNEPAQRLYDRLGYAFEREDGTDLILSRAP